MKHIFLTLILTLFTLSIQSQIPLSSDEILIQRTHYKVAWNPSLGRPSWVSWKLYRSLCTGTAKRLSYFKTDPVAPKIGTSLYTRSGYTRGHMAPAGDFRGSSIAMKESFYMTNISAQTSKLNCGIWETLEDSLRSLTQVYDTIYVISGTSGSQGTIGSGLITIPKYLWKAAVGREGNSWKVLGYWVFTNTDTPTKRRVTLTKIKSLLGGRTITWKTGF